ncbi:rIII lysis inhibitor accessory [Enterobacter phage vB-EclM_KMB17]|uniref:Lysis inhibition accessory protein n=3 Tax=Karamvirus TaxID=1913650 RepID=A0A2R3ZX98_9CAUD|nr:lysis inhibition; accessory protein [Enterobacter phage PG7]YP_010091828.1 lysis inhibition; accessory protein [Cronobacter phage Pet-CM3-4]YP_010094094.1 lysis inhibition; accessory protein [Enterobacter phage myPSH1140]UKH49618.1 rIII lysis inhibitor accessory [Enterobacter phage vB-EclM_KMB17]URQ04013.1 rIII lysis inhibitor accessory [Enterobacter phage vB_EclM-UFV01]USL85712.1 lysis inhibition accessory protein [Enterobacter phage fGh-Ecl01]USL86193.1 lysis inhibition accessory protein
MSMNKQLEHALHLQRNSWNAGHDNYGASIDVYAEALEVLKGFKHLNPVQADLRDVLALKDELKFAKPLCSAARKAVRHFVVTLK